MQVVLIKGFEKSGLEKRREKGQTSLIQFVCSSGRPLSARETEKDNVQSSELVARLLQSLAGRGIKESPNCIIRVFKRAFSGGKGFYSNELLIFQSQLISESQTAFIMQAKVEG